MWQNAGSVRTDVSGKLVGTVVNFSALDSILEGDPHLYIDESQTPRFCHH